MIGSNEKLMDVSAGNNTTVLNVSGHHFGLGDNQKHQLGVLLKRISSEPEIIKAVLEETKQELTKVKCGNGFTVGIGCDGRLYGAGELSKIGLTLLNNSYTSNGLYPVAKTSIISRKDAIEGVIDIACGDFLVCRFRDGKLKMFTEYKDEK